MKWIILYWRDISRRKVITVLSFALCRWRSFYKTIPLTSAPDLGTFWVLEWAIPKDQLGYAQRRFLNLQHNWFNSRPIDWWIDEIILACGGSPWRATTYPVSPILGYSGDIICHNLGCGYLHSSILLVALCIPMGVSEFWNPKAAWRPWSFQCPHSILALSSFGLCNLRIALKKMFHGFHSISTVARWVVLSPKPVKAVAQPRFGPTRPRCDKSWNTITT